MKDDESVFHAGERALQLRAGAEVRARMALHGPHLIRDFMPDQHREFFENLPFIIVGSVDGEGQPWASILANPHGFIQSPSAHRLTISAVPAAYDPLSKNLQQGAALGLLGIEQHTRRRNRMNGIVAAKNTTNFSVDVRQSFGNCPKYIQARAAIFSEQKLIGHAVRSPVLDANAQRLIRNADTFFIASAHFMANTHPQTVAQQRAQGVDISHRGGQPGFVQIENNCLTVPDYAGNNFFNTLGNLMLEPRAGLLFIDFANGDILYVAVHAEIIWEPAQLEKFRGAERLLHMQVTQTIYVARALPLRWGPAQISPYLKFA